jgi:YD repeat-containing protein
LVCVVVALVFALGFGSSSRAAVHCRRVRSYVRHDRLVVHLPVCVESGGVSASVRALETRREWLAGAVARAQRARSRMAFHGLGAAAAQRLTREDFGTRLVAADPAEVVARAGKLVRYVSDSRAVVRSKNGRLKAITSLLPLRSASGGGSERPVDLGVRSAGNGFTAVNPLEPLSISRHLAGGVSVGSGGVRVVPEGSNVAGRTVGGQSVFYASVGEDEDVAVAPRLEGVEISTVLRSRMSPRQIAYRVVLPAGASMRAGTDGARIVRAGHVIAEVPAPSAVDAQGAFVPVQMHTDGDRLVLDVGGRSSEVDYPVLVDPRILTRTIAKSARGWEGYACDRREGQPAADVGNGVACASQNEGPQIETPEAGVLSAPAADYGPGEIKNWITIRQWHKEHPFDGFEFVYFERGYEPYAQWIWLQNGTTRGDFLRQSELTYEGVSVTPGEVPTEAEQEEDRYGSGWWEYTIGCYVSSDLAEAPPVTISEHNSSGSEDCVLPKLSLGLKQAPQQGVFWSPPEGKGFSVRIAPSTIPTSVSIENMVIVEEARSRGRGARKSEHFGSRNAGKPHQKDPCEADPVNCATGNLTETQTDLQVSGRGGGLTLARTYNSQEAATEERPGKFGYGWSWTYGAHVVGSEFSRGVKNFMVTLGNGSTVFFTKTASGMTTPPGTEGSFREGEDDLEYTLPDQTVMRFVGNELTETDRNGNTTSESEVCHEGCHIVVTDPAGRELSLYENEEGLIERATDPMGNTVRYGYENGNLVSVTEPGESTPRWRFRYDSRHRMTAMTEGDGDTTTTEYDPENQVTVQTSPRGHVHRFTYAQTGEATVGASSIGLETEGEELLPEMNQEEEDEFVVPIHIKGPPEYTTETLNEDTGAVTLEHFDAERQLTAITNGYGTSKATTRSLTYNSEDDLTSETDGAGHTTSYAYDGEGNETAETDPLGDKREWKYDSKHDVTSETAPNGETTTIRRDEHGNAIEVSRPAPGGQTQTTKYTYNLFGELTEMTDPLGQTWRYEYDNEGDRIADIDPEGGKRTFTYSRDSRETSTTSPRGNVPHGEPARYTTTIERDAQGRVVRVIEPLE